MTKPIQGAMTPEERARHIAEMLDQIDWTQVVMNGGPPCFAVEEQRYCLRARRWDGHGIFHKYCPLSEMVMAAIDEAAIDAAMADQKD